MHTNLTVFEQLLYTARLRLPITMRRETQLKGVHHVISQLRLDDVEHSIIGDAKRRGISGGQRKRVNIAMELMADPTILFCDEPTSGLDAANSLLVMAMLRSLSSRGLTIMAVIHQPRVEIYEQLHQVLLLGRGGFTAYHGDAKLAVNYFSGLGFVKDDAQNPADFLIDVVDGHHLLNEHGGLDSDAVAAMTEPSCTGAASPAEAARSAPRRRGGGNGGRRAVGTCGGRPGDELAGGEARGEQPDDAEGASGAPSRPATSGCNRAERPRDRGPQSATSAAASAASPKSHTTAASPS